ncbi:hypothetical protein GCM10009839_14160 [Catenulispora yoronensis]|uniref:Uncharacterized protein n=1 Tax=Catenulispora yoronensis TaxID=450799 RepID=A0ABP5F769_9ACTN
MSPDPLAQVRTDLRNAARIIRTNGLMQHNYCDYDQAIASGIRFREARLCTLGGVHVAISGDPLPVGYHENPRITAATGHLRGYLMHQYGTDHVIDWNDTDGRTAADVVRLLFKAAAWTPTAVVPARATVNAITTASA